MEVSAPWQAHKGTDCAHNGVEWYPFLIDLGEPIYLWAGGLPWGEHLLHFIHKVAISLQS